MDGLFERWAVEDGQRDEGESSAVVCGGAYQTQTLAVDHRAAQGDSSIATGGERERERERDRERQSQSQKTTQGRAGAGVVVAGRSEAGLERR